MTKECGQRNKNQHQNHSSVRIHLSSFPVSIMPIHRTLELTDISDAEFDRVDYAVMQHAYAIQNEFGRLFDERIYENELALRLRADGFIVHTQVPLKVVHGSFTKVY
jgi:hypothetical protein